MAYLNEYWNDYKDEGLVIIETNISKTDDLQSFLDYCRTYDVQYLRLMSTDGGLKVPEVFSDNFANKKWLVFTDGTFKENPVKGDILKSINPDDVTPPVIQLLEPKEQDVFTDADRIAIRWSASDENELYQISIYFSEDEGANYKKLGMTPGTMEYYPWYNPEANSDKCRIKVVATDVGLNESEDVSGNFTIVTSTTALNDAIDLENRYTINLDGQKYPVPGTDNVTMKIFSLKGQHLFLRNWKTVTKDTPVNIPGLSAGVYLMRLQSGRDVAEYRVVLR